MTCWRTILAASPQSPRRPHSSLLCSSITLAGKSPARLEPTWLNNAELIQVYRRPCCKIPVCGMTARANLTINKPPVVSSSGQT
jgi:hypothetical protein